MKDLTAATIVADSTWDGVRLVTFHLTFPRFILAEFNTHRAFSRSSASSRAIPIKRQIELIRENPFVPQQWPKNQRGMSASEYLPEYGDKTETWLEAMEYCIARAEELGDYGVHKQITNRLLEPFMWHTVICSTTMPGLDNFFAQRDHPDAQPEMQVLARKMREALEASTPLELQWHVPFANILYINADLIPEEMIEREVVRSISKCARVSYGRELEERTYEEDEALVKRLITSNHWSPLEHVAVAKDAIGIIFSGGSYVGNFEPPWQQIRHHWKSHLPSLATEIDAKTAQEARGGEEPQQVVL